jgi:DNA-binding LytR/AlgR family response regulator
MNAPRGIIAEDEPVLRQQLRRRLNDVWPELDVLLETSCGEDTLTYTKQHKPDVLFLDIRMPNLSGIEVAREVGGLCHIVFVTAYDEYAVQAFEQGAIDYLLKPVSEERLRAAVERVKQRLGSPPPDMQDALAGLSQHAGPTRDHEFLRWIKASMGAAVRLIPTDEVLYFQSDEKYTRVVTADSEALIKVPIKELIERLDPVYFWQIHRATIVNARAIGSASRDFRDRLLVHVKGHQDKLKVSRAYQHLFRQM